MSGQYAANFVQGLEHSTETPYPLQGSACCKHFVANELDGWNGTDRNHIVRNVLLLRYVLFPLVPLIFIPSPFSLHITPFFYTPLPPKHLQDVFVPQQDLVDSYLPSFQTCVEEGKVSGIMWCVTRCSSTFFFLLQPPLS